MKFQNSEDIKDKIEEETRLQIEEEKEIKTDEEGFLHFSFEVSGVVMDRDDLQDTVVQYVNLHGETATAEGVLMPEENEVLE